MPVQCLKKSQLKSNNCVFISLNFGYEICTIPYFDDKGYFAAYMPDLHVPSISIIETVKISDGDPRDFSADPDL